MRAIIEIIFEDEICMEQSIPAMSFDSWDEAQREANHLVQPCNSDELDDVVAVAFDVFEVHLERFKCLNVIGFGPDGMVKEFENYYPEVLR